MSFNRKEFDDLLDSINLKTAKSLEKMLDDVDGVQNPTIAAAINFLKLHRRVIEPPMPEAKADSAMKILIDEDDD